MQISLDSSSTKDVINELIHKIPHVIDQHETVSADKKGASCALTNQVSLYFTFTHAIFNTVI